MANGRVVGIRFGAALAALTMLAVSAPAVAATAAQTRPNILIVLTDDQRLNGAMFEMPKTLSLFGDGGTQFTNYDDTTPLCCPSRGSIWSGEYAHNHGVLTNGDHAAELAYDQTTTLQSYLQGAATRRRSRASIGTLGRSARRRRTSIGTRSWPGATTTPTSAWTGRSSRFPAIPRT